MEKVSAGGAGKLGSGNIYFQIVKIALPAILSLLVSAVYLICDTYFLGVLGILSCGGVCYPAVAVMQGIAMTFAFGAANNISRCIGCGDSEGGKMYFFSGLAGCVLAAVFIGCVVGMFADVIVDFCGGGEAALEVAKYLAIQGFSFVCFSVYFYFAATLRSEGRAAVVMIAAVAGLCCNFGLNYISVKYLDFGAVGVAFATCFSQILAAAMLFFAILKSKITSLDFFYFSFRGVFQIITLGGSSFFRQLMGGVSAFALNYVCVKLGGETLAGATVAARVSVLLFSFGLGLGQGMQPVLAYYFGVGDNAKAKKAFVFTLILTACVGVLVGGIQFLFASEITSVFAGENHLAAAVALKILRVSAFAAPFSFCIVVINMAFQAAGKKVANVLISVLRQGVVFVPALFVLSGFFGVGGVVFSHFASDIISFAVAAVACGKFLKFEKS